MIMPILIGIIVGVLLGIIMIKNENFLYPLLAYVLGIIHIILIPYFIGVLV